MFRIVFVSFNEIAQQNDIEDVQSREVLIVSHESRRVVGQRSDNVQRVVGQIVQEVS
jgi:hypothetical protein